MTSQYRAKVLLHLTQFHAEVVIKETPEVVLSRMWWRCKAGTRRIDVDTVTEVINSMLGHLKDGLKTEIFEVIVAVLQLALVRVASDDKI